MTNKLPEDERERRIQALQKHDTVTAAAQELDMNPSPLANWARRNYPNYDDEFGNMTNRGPRRKNSASQRRAHQNAVLATIHDLNNPAVRHATKDSVLANRAIQGAIKNLEWLADELAPNTRDGDEA